MQLLLARAASLQCARRSRPCSTRRTPSIETLENSAAHFSRLLSAIRPNELPHGYVSHLADSV